MRATALAAGALLLAVVGWTPAATAHSGRQVRPRTVDIRIHHSRFAPTHLELPAGSWVRFVVRNDDPIDHEFLVGDDAFQLRHELGTELRHPPRPGEISVPAASVVETTIAFGGDPARIWYGCHLPGHWDYGMKGRLTLRT